MSEPADPTIGRELIGFFARFRNEPIAPNWKEGDTLESTYGLSTEAADVLRRENAAEIEQHVQLGQTTPMIFWPPRTG